MRRHPARGCVYVITNTCNGKVYIGSAAKRTPKERKRDHWDALRKGKHTNYHLQSAWNMYGELSFSFNIIEFCTPEECISIEQIHIDMNESTNPDYGYNLCPLARSSLGIKRTSETKARISAGKKNPSWQVRRNISRSRKEGIKSGAIKRIVGENHGRSKLREDAARQIIELYRSKPRWSTLEKLAKVHNVTATTVYRVVTGRSWKHLV